MVKLVVKKPGFFVSIPSVGSFRSPFKIKIHESYIPLIETEFRKNGIDFDISTEKDPTLKKEQKSTEVTSPVDLEVKSLVDLSEVMKRLNDIQSLVQKVLERPFNPIKEIVIQEGDKVLSKVQKGELKIPKIEETDIEQDIFVPSLSTKESTIDLTVKTSEKDDVSSRVELLSNLKK